MIDLNKMAARVHEANTKWWVSLETGEPLKRNMGELCMLVVSELSEALEGHRKGLMDDKLPHRRMFEVELADTLIRLLDIAGGHGWSLIVAEGNPFNADYNVAEELLDITTLVIRVYSHHHMPRYNAGIACSVAIRRVFDLARRQGLDLIGAFEEKMAYNATRADHTAAHRMAAGGKKY